MKTKISLMIFAVFSVMFIASCNDLKKAAAIDYNYTLPRTAFRYTPVSYKTGEQVLFEGPVTANLDSILRANGFSSGAVGTTTLTRCSVTIDKPDTVNFGWLQSVRGEISDNSGFSPFVEAGQATNTDPLARTINLTMNNTNIRPYLGSRVFYIRIVGTLPGPVPVQWIDMFLDGQLKMRLQPLN